MDSAPHYTDKSERIQQNLDFSNGPKMQASSGDTPKSIRIDAQTCCAVYYDEINNRWLSAPDQRGRVFQVSKRLNEKGDWFNQWDITELQDQSEG